MAALKCTSCGKQFYGTKCPTCGSAGAPVPASAGAKNALALLFGIGVTGFIVWTLFLKSDAPYRPAQPATVAQSSPVYSVTASILYGEYSANEVAADNKYKDRVIAVSGIIQNIGKDVLDNPYIVVGGHGILDGVQCTFPPNPNSPVASVHKGQSVTVKGKVAGKMGNVLLNECQFQ